MKRKHIRVYRETAGCGELQVIFVRFCKNTWPLGECFHIEKKGVINSYFFCVGMCVHASVNNGAFSSLGV